jgi:hypothetical protein
MRQLHPPKGAQAIAMLTDMTQSEAAMW